MARLCRRCRDPLLAVGQAHDRVRKRSRRLVRLLISFRPRRSASLIRSLRLTLRLLRNCSSAAATSSSSVKVVLMHHVQSTVRTQCDSRSTSRTLRIDNLSAGVGNPAVGCRGPRSVDSIVDGNAVQPAISRCPQSSDCCPPSVGILSALRRIPQLWTLPTMLTQKWPSERTSLRQVRS